MKINFVLWGTSPAGGVKNVFQLANILATRRHDVTITSLHNPLQDHKWFPLKVKVYYIHESRVLLTLDFLLRNLNITASSIYEYFFQRLAHAVPECDVNVATFCLTAFPVYRSEKGRPFYYIQHHEPLYFFSDYYMRKLAEETYYLPLTRIANSTWVHDQLLNFYRVDSKVITPGIDTNIFYPRKVERKDKKMRILSQARTESFKGLQYLVEALRQILKLRKDIEIVLFGFKDPKIKAIPYTFIKFPKGDSLAKLYSSADIYVISSLAESFPLTPLEAMACGTPVVATRYGTEDYCFNEVNSLVVPPKDPKALANAVLRLLDDDDLREKLRKEGLKTVKQFTWDRTADKFERLFREALRGDLNG